MPPKKAADPLALCHWKKKRKVRSRPITKASPLMKRICETKKKKKEVLRMHRCVLSHVIFTHISYCQETLVEEKQDAQEEKGDSETGQAHADL